MKINADLNRRAVVNSEDLDWVDSPLAGVARRMLERDGAESGRATTIVRYAPGSHFSSHVHTGGEEYLVLDGVFSDETGDFGPGTYVRNPVGSRHRPHSEDGCVIFVKLWQMEPDDQEFVRIDTAKAEWLRGPVDGVSFMPLHRRGLEEVSLVKAAPGTNFARHSHDQGEEILVLDGVIEDEHGRYPKGTWVRSPPRSAHTPFSTEGATLYVKTGHLKTEN